MLELQQYDISIPYGILLFLPVNSKYNHQGNYYVKPITERINNGY